jgi:hypothetical protein
MTDAPTDIVVVNATRGETCPFDYLIINKNINAG